MDADDACNELSFSLGTSAATGTTLVSNRQWNIKISQYECGYSNLAPSGCTQVILRCLKCEKKQVKPGFTNYQIFLRISNSVFHSEWAGLLLVQGKLITVVHDFNGHEVNGIHGLNGKKCYDKALHLVNNLHDFTGMHGL